MNEPPTVKNASPRKKSKTGQLVRLLARYIHVHYRKVRPSRRDWLRSQYLLGEASPWTLLRECVSDLHTALYRMGRRVGALPFLWSAPFGGSVIDPSGNLVPNTRTLGCMTDMQRSEGDFPTATGFDWEMFQIGWEAGAKWGESNSCRQEQAGNTCNPPDRNSISDSAGKVTPPRWSEGVLND
jgi:hypothetical protein